jgi:hypothetical protein
MVAIGETEKDVMKSRIIIILVLMVAIGSCMDKCDAPKVSWSEDKSTATVSMEHEMKIRQSGGWGSSARFQEDWLPVVEKYEKLAKKVYSVAKSHKELTTINVVIVWKSGAREDQYGNKLSETGREETIATITDVAEVRKYNDAKSYSSAVVDSPFWQSGNWQPIYRSR